MHQSIPAVPIPPGQLQGICSRCQSQGWGISKFYRRPGGWALAYPGATPRHLPHKFSKDGWVYREGRGLNFVKDWLIRRQGLEKPANVFKYVFSGLDISSLLVSI